MTEKPFLQVLKGKQALDTPPVWLMRQAGRYLPEYRALRAKAPDFLGFCLNPALAAEATLQPIRRYPDLDAAIVFADILLIPHALGWPVEFTAGEGPSLAPFRTAEDLKGLHLDRAPNILAPVGETLRHVRAELPPTTSLIGFAGSPWTVACYMLASKNTDGGKDFFSARAFAWQQPAVLAQLFAVLEKATTVYLVNQIAAGAEAVMLFDSWAGVLPASQFETWITNPNARIIANVRKVYPEVPILAFPRGAGMNLATFASHSSPDGIGIDTAQSLASARQILEGVQGTYGKNVVIQGNLDPALLQVGGTALQTEITAMRKAMEGYPYIFNLGHGIDKSTPPEHVTELLRAVKQG